MALANTYGLLFIILLLGHGLVQVPRQLWETSFIDRELQRLYFAATQVRMFLLAVRDVVINSSIVLALAALQGVKRLATKRLAPRGFRFARNVGRYLSSRSGTAPNNAISTHGCKTRAVLGARRASFSATTRTSMPFQPTTRDRHKALSSL